MGNKTRKKKFYFRFLNRRERKPSSMTTPISRPVVVRRPWIEYLKDNRERWIREAGEYAINLFLLKDFLLFYIYRRRQTSKRIESY
jgi:hypothetical protein